MFNALDTFCALQMPVQKRSSPNMKSSATVTRAEISSEPKQPRRLEKKKNMFAMRLRWI